MLQEDIQPDSLLTAISSAHKSLRFTLFTLLALSTLKQKVARATEKIRTPKTGSAGQSADRAVSSSVSTSNRNFAYYHQMMTALSIKNRKCTVFAQDPIPESYASILVLSSVKKAPANQES
ncbi:MAG: hypothetical protein J6M93_06430 [Succinivibrio sp.]|nr:hypothetical protein [Succinivibrio sp.]